MRTALSMPHIRPGSISVHARVLQRRLCNPSSTAARMSSSPNSTPSSPNSSSDSSKSPFPIYSANADPARLGPSAHALLAGRWKLTRDRRGVERAFQFKTFKKTWDFMTLVAAECQRQKHHPEWANVYNKLHVRWTTHNPPGLSEKDVFMARFCDERAKAGGEVVPEGAEGGGKVEDGLRDLADEVASGAGECCVGKR